MSSYRRKLQLLISINLVLALVISLGLVFSPARSGKRAESRTILPDSETVARISIEGVEALELVKSGTTWVLMEPGSISTSIPSNPSEASLPAEAARVRAFLGILSGIDRLETVASGRSSWGALGLDDGQANRLVLYDQNGTRLVALSVGTYDPTGSSSYLRIDPSETVYAGPSSLASYLSGGRRSWLDLRIWDRNFGASDVQSLVLRGGLDLPDGTRLDTDYRLTRSGAVWVADQSGVQLDTQKVDGMVRSILAARSEEYLEQDALDQPVLIISLGLGDGSSLELSISDGGAGDRFAALSSRRAHLLALSSWTIRDAVRPLAALLVQTP